MGGRQPREIPSDVLAWMDALPTLWEDDRRIYVHAGLYPGLDRSEQTDQIRLWIRDEFLTSSYDFGKHVVHGHTPVRNGLPDVRPNRTNLDTAAVFGGPLTAGVFTSEQGAPVGFIRAHSDGTIMVIDLSRGGPQGLTDVTPHLSLEERE